MSEGISIAGKGKDRRETIEKVRNRYEEITSPYESVPTNPPSPRTNADATQLPRLDRDPADCCDDACPVQRSSQYTHIHNKQNES